MKLYADIKVGDTEYLKHTITENDIQKFVELTGDDNKLHIDAEFAKTTSFKKPVVHGMLGASFISTIIGTKLPGDGALWFSQTLEFLLPVRIGDELTITATVVKKHDKEQIIELNVSIANQDRQVVTKGISKVKVVEQKVAAPQEEIQKSRKKYALVIGGTGGIGSAVCRELANEQFFVLVHYNRNKELADAIRQDIVSGGGQAAILQCDITKTEAIAGLRKDFERYAGELDVLVNCSSMKIPRVPFRQLTWKDYSEQINFHVKSTFEVCSAFIDLLEKNRCGKIINIGTLAVDKPNTEWSHYITAKAALHGLTKSMAVELGPKGITVNMVSPGLTDTELTADIPERIKLITASQTPLRRLGTVEDISGAVSFLASDKANFMTGENLRLNGGQFSI